MKQQPLLILIVFITALAADAQTAESVNWNSPIDLHADALAQHRVLESDIRNADHINRHTKEVYHKSALILPSDRDPLDVILRRSRVLLEDIKIASDSPDMKRWETELATLEKNAANTAIRDTRKRLDLFKTAHVLRRNIAFENPLLDFDELLFIKRHRSTYNHMCDQYYGSNARPGGSVFVLSSLFSDRPAVVDLLAKTRVSSGRLKGLKLDTGSFLSPEISYDGEKVYFAYTECSGKNGHIQHLDHANHGHWERGRCYHLFSFELHTSKQTAHIAKNLCQLTDGTFNDFDPYPLPNGRLAFISERRGGYLRCGRSCPSYTIHDMKPDGTDIRILSPHENNEWHPSVNHDGMLIYTRWDYVDRHGCTAHHPWIMTPDGRNSRAMHGNFSIKSVRADMEMDLRAIPWSQKIVGTAAPHHGQAFGSIIIYNPGIPDDDAMAPVKRITPEVDFPESQGGKEVYGTPWPLSEKYYICVYDSDMQYSPKAKQNRSGRGNYGIYLLDAFGNKILLYRDPDIACLSPMPLRARNKPPNIPEATQRLKENPPDEGVMAVMNVYDSQIPWPKNTEIKALRIFQILPSSVPSGNPPHETGHRIAEARDSVNLARKVLGSVPVEKDGSAHFKVPALKEVYFQALDKDGLAVQSMRSSTWVQPGEMMVCHGCHESREHAPPMRNHAVLALQRPPSVPTPDVTGSNPFSYPLLVQPVLDKNCVECHDKNLASGAPPLDRKIVTSRLGSKPTKVFRSYESLIHDFAFWEFGDQYRTVPGKFGARGSRLYPLLKSGHHGVILSKEEMHRITLWLDSASNFYGVYEKEGGEAQLKGETPTPTLE